MVYETDEHERLFRGHTGALFVLLTVALVCLQLSQRLLPPFLPVIIDDLGITAFLAGIALTLLRVSRAGVEYPGGRFADERSRTVVLLCALTLTTIGVAMLYFSRSYWLFLSGVTIFGMGLGLYIPASRALLSDVFVEKRGRAFGLHMMGSDVSGILASGIAIWILTVAAWQVTFLPLFLVLLPFPVLLYYLSREQTKRGRIELGLFDTVRRLLGEATVRWTVVVYSLFIFASGGVTGFLPAYLIESHGVSFAFASSAFALIYVVGVVAKPLSGTISDKVSRPLVAGSGLVLASAGLIILLIAPSVEVMILGIVVHSLGHRGMPPALQAYLMDHFSDANRGADFGGVRAIYQMFGSLGPGFTGLVISLAGFEAAYGCLAAIFIAGATILIYCIYLE